eukprot:scaffold11739_cov129-Isochrysis_galbana.AAC.3
MRSQLWPALRKVGDAAGEVRDPVKVGTLVLTARLIPRSPELVRMGGHSRQLLLVVAAQRCAARIGSNHCGSLLGQSRSSHWRCRRCWLRLAGKDRVGLLHIDVCPHVIGQCRREGIQAEPLHSIHERRAAKDCPRVFEARHRLHDRARFGSCGSGRVEQDKEAVGDRNDHAG